MAGAGKDRIDVIKQELPKFIRDFKERTNQREAPNVNTKRKIPNKDIDEGDDELQKADEAPVICIDKGVSEEEAYKFTKEFYGEEVVSSLNAKRKHSEDDEGEESGKVIFKKPSKEKEGRKNLTTKKESKMPKVKNQTLLSFGDEEEEE